MLGIYLLVPAQVAGARAGWARLEDGVSILPSSPATETTAGSSTLPHIDPTELRALLHDLPIEESAPYLLGATLVSPEATAQIVEVEAYGGPNDPGSHAARGPTPRNLPMFGPPGHAYVYFTYGCHWMLNVTGRPEGEPGAVLVRAAMPVSGSDILRSRRPKAKGDKGLLSGPGKLAAAFAIDKRHNANDLFDRQQPLHLIPARDVRPYKVGVRVGIAVGKGHDIPWRFIDEEFEAWASLPRLRESLSDV